MNSQHASSMIHRLTAICPSSEDLSLHFMDNNAEDNTDRRETTHRLSDPTLLAKETVVYFCLFDPICIHL
jgi:hypothetical protein